MTSARRPDDVIPPNGGSALQLRRLATDAARVLPNLLKLIGRLLADPRVPRRSKLVVALAVGYIASPIDLVPEFIPLLGVADDVLLAVFVINHLIHAAGQEVVLEHWDGPIDLLGFVQGVLEVASELVPRRIRRLVERLAG